MKKILIASAYKLFIKKYSSLLMRMGLRIFTATNAAAALAIHARHDVDIILLDYKLEDMSGTTFCSLVRKGDTSPQLPIIISCHNIPGSLESVRQCGASSILVKPIEPIKAIEMIENFLDLQLVRSRRVTLRVEVACKHRENVFRCFSNDISNTGVLLETDIDLDLGSRISCQFTLPDACQINVEGVVIRFRTAPEFLMHYGVKFLAPAAFVRNSIDSYINSIQKDIPLRIDKTNDCCTNERLVLL